MRNKSKQRQRIRAKTDFICIKHLLQYFEAIMNEASKSYGSVADDLSSQHPSKKLRKGDDQIESLGGHPTVRDHPVIRKKRRVRLYDDRVTFTVQNEIAVESHSESTAPFSRFESQPSASDGAEDPWLRAFTRYLRQHSSQRCSDSGNRPDPMAVQAFYHSSDFSRPTMAMQMGDVSNGLVCACLSAFTEVIHALHSFARQCKALTAAQAPGSPPRRYISSSHRCCRHFCVSKRRSIPQCVRES
jgi:hypothetical protein